jgi:hypothetical protein
VNEFTDYWTPTAIDLPFNAFRSRIWLRTLDPIPKRLNLV